MSDALRIICWRSNASIAARASTSSLGSADTDATGPDLLAPLADRGLAAADEPFVGARGDTSTVSRPATRWTFPTNAS